MTEPSTGGYSNPARLTVKARETRPSDSDPGPSNYGEKERLLRAKKRNEEVRRKGDQWADKLMEETVDRGTFRRAVRTPCSCKWWSIASYPSESWDWNADVLLPF